MRLTGSEQLGYGYLEVRWGWGSGSEQLFGGGLVFIYSITCELASGVCAGIHTPTGLRSLLPKTAAVPEPTAHSTVRPPLFKSHEKKNSNLPASPPNLDLTTNPTRAREVNPQSSSLYPPRRKTRQSTPGISLRAERRIKNT